MIFEQNGLLEVIIQLHLRLIEGIVLLVRAGESHL